MSESLNLIEFLRRKGFKVTEVRNFVLSLLQNSKKPFTAGEIQSALEKGVKKVNKTTVYRELQFLLNQGVACEVDFGDGKKRYEIAGLPHHHHLVCMGCRKVEDIDMDNDLMTMQKKIYNLKKFKIATHSLEFFGVCKACS